MSGDFNKLSAVFQFEGLFMPKTITGKDSPPKMCARVELHVDYAAKKFKVVPGNGSLKGEFVFKEAYCHQSDMWITIAELIKDAIEYGQYEVGQKHRTLQK